MRTAHGVKVVLLHQQDILHHRLLIHDLTMQRMMLVTVNAANQQRLAVQQQQTIFNPHFAETDIAGFCFNQRAVGSVQFNHRTIEIRDFGAPQRRVFDVQT